MRRDLNGFTGRAQRQGGVNRRSDVGHHDIAALLEALETARLGNECVGPGRNAGNAVIACRARCRLDLDGRRLVP